MNLLSSNEASGTAGVTHSSTGVPLVPNPLNRSSVARTKSVVGAAVMDWDPATEYGSVARQTSAPTAKSMTITIFSDFMYFFSSVLGHVGPNGKGVILSGWPDFRGTLLTRC